MKTYFDKKNDVSAVKSCLMLGKRIVIPVDLKVLQGFCRLGVVQGLERARISVYWSEMELDMKKFVEKIEICQIGAKLAPRVENERDSKPRREGIRQKPVRSKSEAVY